ncbi:glycosyltransferase family 4 protein [Arhodomonas sp. SL1]|uniref:glycosyltransferase family 4 protein n=1 Tax=Arhodomonas sp. SL1 TaxID=3425691 RepID=UPI003F885431
MMAQRAAVAAHPTPLRVLHVVRTDDPAGGGIIHYINRLGEGLAGSGITMGVQAVFGRDQARRVLSVRAPLAFLRRTRRALREADVLHAHGIFGWHVLLGVLAARLEGRPYVITLHGHLHSAALRERFLAKWLYLRAGGERILRRAAMVLVSAAAEQTALRAHSPRARAKMLVPALPVPETATPPPPGDPGDTLQVLFIGRLHPHKGLPELLEAVARLRGGGQPVALQVAGNGHPHQRRDVEARIRRLGLEDCVSLLGHVDTAERDRRLQASHVLALPSHSENFGFAVAEAMALGRPVVASEGVGAAEIVAERDCGRVIPVSDVDALAEALYACTDPERRRRWGRRAHRAAWECFLLGRLGSDAAAVYRDAVAADATGHSE